MALSNPIKKEYSDTSGGQCHFRYMEGVGTPIVFLHQTPSSSLMFEAIMHELKGMQMFAIDTPGFGQSFDPDHNPSISEYCDWLIEALNCIGLKEFHLFGHHTGASMALQIACDQPKSTHSLTMVGPFLATHEEKQEMKKNISSDWSPKKDGSHLQTVWHLTGEILGAAKNLNLRHRETIDALRAHHSAKQIHEAIWQHSDIELFKEINCPSLIMCAPDDVMFPFFKRAETINKDTISKEIKGKNLELDLDTKTIADYFKIFIDQI